VHRPTSLPSSASSPPSIFLLFLLIVVFALDGGGDAFPHVEGSGGGVCQLGISGRGRERKRDGWTEGTGGVGVLVQKHRSGERSSRVSPAEDDKEMGYTLGRKKKK
jgi:hypothetical protein